MIEIANSGNLQLPKNLSTVARDLICRILVPDVSLRYDLDDIKDHQFFKQLDWSKVASRQLTPPYVPEPPIELKQANTN